MTETDPCNDVTPPCGDCGDCALTCACGKPIETVAQLQRALEAAGAMMNAVRSDDRRTWAVFVWNTRGDGVYVDKPTMSEAIEAALDAWWER